MWPSIERKHGYLDENFIGLMGLGHGHLGTGYGRGFLNERFGGIK